MGQLVAFAEVAHQIGNTQNGNNNIAMAYSNLESKETLTLDIPLLFSCMYHTEGKVLIAGVQTGVYARKQEMHLKTSRFHASLLQH